MGSFIKDEFSHIPGYGYRTMEAVVGASISFVYLATIAMRTLVLFWICFTSKKVAPFDNDVFKTERMVLLGLVILFLVLFLLHGHKPAEDSGPQTLNNWAYSLLICLPMLEAWSGSFGKLWKSARYKDEKEEKDNIYIHIYDSNGNHTYSESYPEERK